MLRIFSKFSLKSVFQQNWDRDSFRLATTVYRLYRHRKPFVWFLGFQLFVLPSHWSGLLIRSLIGPSMMTGHMTLISDFPILSLTYTVESVNVRLCYLLLLFTIYLQYLFTFRRCGENIKYKDFALNCRQSVFRELKWIVNQTTLKNDKLRISWKFRNFKLYNSWRLL